MSTMGSSFASFVLGCSGQCWTLSPRRRKPDSLPRGSLHRAHDRRLAAASAEEEVPLGLDPRRPGRHLERLENATGGWVDAPQLLRVVFPGAVPELAVGERYARHEAIGAQRLDHLPGRGVDLMDRAPLVLPDP